MLRGYVRCSTGKQTLAQQIDQLRAAGCERKNIFQDKAMSAKARQRPSLSAIINASKRGDTIMVTAIDRAFRNTREALLFLDDVVVARGVAFVSLRDRIDPTTHDGRRQYIRIAADAEYESATIAVRTHDKMAALKRRGRKFGNRRKLSKKKVAWARAALRGKNRKTKVEVARRLRVHPRTVTRALARTMKRRA